MIGIHALQSVAPSNLNRDDTGAPKDAVFGGVRRARISSQCLKRSARVWWRDTYGLNDELAVRTKRLAEPLAGQLVAKGVASDDADLLAERVTVALGLKGNARKKGETAVLVFASPGEIAALADRAIEQRDALLGKTPEAAKAMLVSALGSAASVDLALFGRMLAEIDGTNVDAACSVAHAISTHEVRMEEDYFTAVDDLKSDEEDQGAGMLGEVLFQSACFYRYSSIDEKQLLTNLARDTTLAARAVESYVQAVARAMPTGHQTTFAAHNPPSVVLVTREPDAVSLANAFLEPVPTDASERLDAQSARRMLSEWAELSRLLGGDRRGVICGVDAALPDEIPAGTERVSSFDALAASARAMIQGA